MKTNDNKIAAEVMQTRITFFCLTFLCLLTSLHAAEPVTNSIGIKLVRIEAGTFTMGQDGPPLEDYLRQKRFGEMYKDIDRIDFDEKPAHKVTITQPFLIGATEVTVGQFRQFDPKFKIDDPSRTERMMMRRAVLRGRRRLPFASGSQRRRAKPIVCRPRRNGSMLAVRARRPCSTRGIRCRTVIRNGSERKTCAACIFRQGRCRVNTTGGMSGGLLLS